MKRIVLFLATNLAIVLVLSLTMRILGVEPYLTANGLEPDLAADLRGGDGFRRFAASRWPSPSGWRRNRWACR